MKTAESDFRTLTSRGSWIATIRPQSRGINHAVVVDGFDAAGNVVFRDPADGMIKTMTLSHFIEIWTLEAVALL